MRSLSPVALILGLSAILSIGQGLAYGTQEKDREALCRRVPCREATTVALKLDERRHADFAFPRGPYVADGVINILNGERFSVEFEEKDGRLVEPHYVKEVTHPDRTISFELSSLESGTLLKIANPFSQAIVYDCLIQHYKQRGFSKTHVLAVGPRLSSFESWPYPVVQVMVSNVQYQSQAANAGKGIEEQDSGDREAVISAKPGPEGAAKSAAEVELVITLKCVFRSDGTVGDIHVVSVKPKHFAAEDVIASLKKKAIEAAKGIKFLPATKNGQPVSMYMQLDYSFSLADDDEQASAPKN